MAPWAYNDVRLALSEVNPKLDIYPLGKVLWSMISGRNGFPFWEFDRNENNLENAFPEEPSISIVNSLLAKCVVREEKECMASATQLLAEVDELIAKIKSRQGYRPDGARSWPCRVCGKGDYRNGGLSYQVVGHRQGGPIQVQTIHLDVNVCDHCGHAELFGKPAGR